MKHVVFAILLTVAAYGTAHADQGPSDAAFRACEVSPEERERLMALPLRAFDQDMQGGWRAVAYRDGCDPVAAALLEAYIARHALTPDDGVVTWHLGQIYAGMGDYERALDVFREEYDPALEPGQAGYDWSLYARGTIAFLERDRERLAELIDEFSAIPMDPERVAAMKRFAEENDVTFPEEALRKPLNLIVLEGLLRCFDAPYKTAYGQCEATEE